MPDQDDAQQPVTVFKSGDPGLLAVAQSLLEGADIEFFAAGAAAAGLFPGGISRFPVEIRVAAADAEDARQLLKELG